MNVYQANKALREYGKKLKKQEPSMEAFGSKFGSAQGQGAKKQRKGRGKHHASNFELYRNFANNTRSSSSVKKKLSPNLPLRNRA